MSGATAATVVSGATVATAVTATIAARSAIGLVLASAGATTETGRGVLTASGAATASAGTRDRISPRRPSSRSVRSQSASARASSVASKCSLGSPRSSALSPSWRCREWRRFDSGCARTTRGLKAEDKPEMPEATVLKMAENLLPQLRVADWLDRAEAAKRQLAHLDLARPA